jgi:hypothetical protein
MRHAPAPEVADGTSPSSAAERIDGDAIESARLAKLRGEF